MAFSDELDQHLLSYAQTFPADRWLLWQTAYTGASRRHALYQLPANSHSRIADIGCGFGAAVLEMAEHFQAQVEGFDCDLARLDAAQHLSRHFPLLAERVDFTAADVTHDQPRQPFDLVTARFVLQYLPAVETLSHWRQWIRPGGGLYLEEVDDGWTVEYPGPPLAWKRVLDAYQAYAHHQGWDRTIGRKLPQLLERSGYQLTQVVWNPTSFLGVEHPEDPQVGFERERLMNLRPELVAEGYLTDAAFQEGLQAFQHAYPRQTMLTGATIQILATPIVA